MDFRFQILNLKCGGCANTVIKEVEAIEGVSDVKVDVETSVVSGEVREENLLEAITKKLTSIGYPTNTEDNNIIRKAQSYVSCAKGRFS